MKELSDYTDEELANLFKNAFEIITKNKPLKNEAEKKIIDIKKEWNKRKIEYLDGKRKIQFPEKGLLSTLGYQAGNMNFEERKNLLKFVIESEELPFVQSPAYMASWGDPKSEKRLIKLSYLLRNLINKKNIYTREETINNWKEDFEYIYQNYYLNNFTFNWPNLKKN